MTTEETKCALKQCTQDRRELKRLEGEICRMERLLSQRQTQTLRLKKGEMEQQARLYIQQMACAIERLKKRQQFWEERMETLPPLQQAVLRLRYWEQMPWRKVAERTGYSEKHMFKIQRAALFNLSREAEL